MKLYYPDTLLKKWVDIDAPTLEQYEIALLELGGTTLREVWLYWNNAQLVVAMDDDHDRLLVTYKDEDAEQPFCYTQCVVGDKPYPLIVGKPQNVVFTLPNGEEYCVPLRYTVSQSVALDVARHVFIYRTPPNWVTWEMGGY
ncbi:MAG TPA: hypothetical protein VHO69_05220 [Phototrophicaceae bacterium]|nr:hypothetical protein [Phototrophicaceae bacterium]